METQLIEWNEIAIEVPNRFIHHSETVDPTDGQIRNIFATENRNQVLIFVRGKVDYTNTRFQEIRSSVKDDIETRTPGLEWKEDEIFTIDNRSWVHFGYIEPRDDGFMHVLMMTHVSNEIQLGISFTIQEDCYHELYPEIMTCYKTLKIKPSKL